MDAVLGATGFVGSTLRERLPHADLYDSKNISDVRGKSYRNIYCACVPAVKWAANKDPEADRAALSKIRTHLGSVASCERLVLISTIDVHVKGARVPDEDAAFEASDEPYGRHRREFEMWAAERFDKVHVVRLPALFGIGIKKNVVYDLIHGHRLEHIPADSAFQWYDLSWLHGDLEYIAENDLRVAHLYPEPVETRDLVRDVFPGSRGKTDDGAARIEYNHGTKHGRFRRSAREVTEAIARFKSLHESVRGREASRLAASNLGWMALPTEHACFVLKRYGITKVEVAPSLFGDIDAMTPEQARGIRARYESCGVTVASMQSVLFGIRGTLATAGPEVEERMKRIEGIAGALGCRVVVFGSPSLRRDCSEDDLVGLLKRVRSACPGIDLCLEANSRRYGCQVGCNLEQVCRAAKAAGVSVNLDTGNAKMESDEDLRGLDPGLVAHAQVSAPFLARVDVACCEHGRALLEKAGARTLVSLETKGDGGELVDNVRAFVSVFGRGGCGQDLVDP